MSAAKPGHVSVPGGTDPTELVPLLERFRYMQAARAACALAVVAVALFVPDIVGVPTAVLALITAGYLAASGAPQMMRRLGKGRVLPLVKGMLLIDGIYLGAVMYATGGTASPVRFLAFAHIIAVTLLLSYRTGLKIALWHTMVYLAMLEAQSVGFLEVPGALRAGFQGLPMLHLAALWMVGLATAAFSALTERELRAQKIDLEQLSAMVAEIDRRADTSEIPGILLEKLRETFGFPRGAVLASPEGDLSLMAYLGEGEPAEIQPGLDAVMERAWTSRETQLVKELDPETAPRLASLLPGGRNVLVVPLFLDRGYRLGVLAVEYPGGDRIKRWVVGMIGQFASHTALALHNGWLLQEVQGNLAEIRSLRDELMAHNATLETQVVERTQELSETIGELRETDEQRRRLLAHLVRAQEDERQRIAGDIHDDPVQKIVAVNMRLQMLRRSCSDPEQAEMVDRLMDAVRSSIGSLRHLLFELSPQILEDAGLAAAINQYLNKAEADLEFEVENGLEAEPPLETRIILYRIAQEALANVSKHAQASRVDVRVDEVDGGFHVHIRDDGVGFAPQEVLVSSPGHLGMTSMRERAELAGGWCRVLSLPGGGTTVEFWLPARADEPEDESEPSGAEWEVPTRLASGSSS